MSARCKQNDLLLGGHELIYLMFREVARLIKSKK